MALRDFQQALADMTLTPGLASAVRIRGSVALTAYHLTAREQRRLEAVARQAGMALTCSLARANRFSPIHDAFPMTCLLLEPHLKQLLDELWHTQRPQNYQLTGEASGFLAIVEHKMAEGALPVAYLADIVRYEKTCWQMAMALRYCDLETVEGNTWEIPFQYKPSALLDALDQGETPPPGLRLGEYLVQLRMYKGELQLEWKE